MSGRPGRVRRFVRDERAAAMVEFALVVPILLVLILGVVDFGRATAVAASLAAAVRDGARVGATLADPTQPAQIARVRARVAGVFQTLGGAPLAPGDVRVAYDAAGFVQVSVEGYAYRPLTPIAGMLGLGTIRLTRAATFRWERAP